MDLLIVDRKFVKYKGVWKVIDKKSGQSFYVKRATPSEVTVTKKVAEFCLPKDSLLVLPEIPFSSNELPQDILKEVLEWEDEFDPKNSRSSILITKAHPVPDNVPTLENDYLRSALRNSPIKESEFKLLIRDVKALNKAGIFNHDYMSNLFPVRNEDNILKFYAIDFEPDTFSKLYSGKYEDVEQLKNQRDKLRRKGLLKRDSFKGAIKEILKRKKQKNVVTDNPETLPSRNFIIPKARLKGLSK